MFNLILSKISTKKFICFLFVAFCLTVLIKFAVTERTGKVIAGSSTENIVEQESGKLLDSDNMPDSEERSFVPQYEAFPKLDKPRSANQFFVAPNGSSSGNGSIAKPWDLNTALSQPSAVKPGAVIWLRGGTYKFPAGTTNFNCVLTGTSEKPIKVLSYPGEWAVIDGNLSNSAIKNKTIVTNKGDYVWFMNFEITNTETSNRKLSVSSSNPVGRRGSSVYDYGTGTKIINLVIHDTGQGIGAWKQGHDNEYYGNIVYNNGWDGPARGNGHGTYTQNKTGYKTFEDNIFLNQFGANSRTGGTDAAAVRNISFVGNVFINGRLSWIGPHIENFKVLSNYTYNNHLKVGNEVNLTFINTEIQDNYLMSGVELFEFTEKLVFKNNTVWNNDPKGKDLVISTINTWNPAKFLIDNNTYYKAFQTKPFWNFAIKHPKRRSELSDDQKYDGEYAFNKTIGSQKDTFTYTKRSWQDDLHIDQNSKYIDSVPDHTRVFLERNKYNSGRARFIIYNWRNLDTIYIDTKSVLNKGESYELRNVQDYFGDVSKGVYQGGRLKISMKGRTLAKPIGYDQFSEWYHDPLKPNTFPTFGVFELIKTAGK